MVDKNFKDSTSTINDVSKVFSPICGRPQRWNGKLDGAICYLSGPMMYAHDGGVQWRQDYIKAVKDVGMQVAFYDPCNKPKDICDGDGLEFHRIAKLKEESKWDEVSELVSTFRHQDLRMVDGCDFVVAYINRKVHTCGTYDEIFMAERQQKPIFAIVEGGKKECPDWLFAAIRWQEMFDSFEESIDHLTKIHYGKIPMDKRWVLIRKFVPNI
jgi:nucleoside 2-deoxyribosyltransferase